MDRQSQPLDSGVAHQSQIILPGRGRRSPSMACQGGAAARGAAPSAADAGRHQAGRPAATRAQASTRALPQTAGRGVGPRRSSPPTWRPPLPARDLGRDLPITGGPTPKLVTSTHTYLKWRLPDPGPGQDPQVGPPVVRAAGGRPAGDRPERRRSAWPRRLPPGAMSLVGATHGCCVPLTVGCIRGDAEGGQGRVGSRAWWPSAAATLTGPARLSAPMTRLRSQAMTRGPRPDRTWEASSAKVTSRW